MTQRHRKTAGKRRRQRNESQQEHPPRQEADERDFQQAVVSLLKNIQAEKEEPKTPLQEDQLPPPLFPEPEKKNMGQNVDQRQEQYHPGDSPPPLDCDSDVEQLRMADEYWVRDVTVQINGQYSTYSELLMSDQEPYGPENKKKGCYVRLPWNRQENNAHGATTRLVYNLKAFKTTEFGKMELFMLISRQMFLNGDCYKTSMFSTWIIARMIQEELISMLIQILNARGRTPEEMENDSCTEPVTYSELVGWMKENCPLRLRRLIKYQMAENSRTHNIHLVRPVEKHRQKQDFLLDQLMDNTPADVRIFRDVCPILFNAVTDHIPYPSQSDSRIDPINNLRFYTSKYDSETEHLIDLHLYLSQQFLKASEGMIKKKQTKEKLEAARKVTMCSLTGRKNAYYAVLFHELLGKPPIETDIIFILNFLARELIREVVIMALRIRREFVESTEDEPIEVPVYIEAITALREETEHPNILCGKPFQFPRPDCPMLELKELPDKEVLTNMDKLIARAKRWHPKKEMEKTLVIKSKKGGTTERITLTADLLANIFSSEMLLRAHEEARPPPVVPPKAPEPQKPPPKRRGRKKKNTVI